MAADEFSTDKCAWCGASRTIIEYETGHTGDVKVTVVTHFCFRAHAPEIARPIPQSSVVTGTLEP